MRTPVLVAVTGLVALGGACGGSSDSQVIAGSPAAPTTADITSDPAPSTTAPDTPPTTSLPPSSTTAEPSSTTTSTPPDGGIVDPEQYASATGLSELATLGEAVLLPTWVPAWAAGVAPSWIGVSDDATFYHVGWKLEVDHPYAQEIGQGTIILHLSRERRTPEHAPLTGEALTTSVRTYTVTDSARTCITGDVDPVPSVLIWDDGDDRYAVAMQPNPACYPDDFSVAQALAFADSLVACDPTGPTLKCEAAPAR